MNSAKFFLVCFLICIGCCWYSVGAITVCSAGENCVIFTDCQDFVRVLRSGRQSNGQLERLRQRTCGFVGKQPLVCCDPVSTNDRNDLDESILPSASECGATSADRIVGGKNADIDEFPWMAIIYYRDVQNPRKIDQFGCGGSLISAKYVLTAAHCVSSSNVIPFPHKPTSVRLGEWDLSTEVDCNIIGFDTDCVTEPVQNIPIAETIAHEEWDEVHQHNDIALIRLQRPARFNYYVKPICLPTTVELQNLNYQDAKFIISGWGTTNSGQKSAVKQKLSVPEVALSICKQKYENLERIPTNNHLCAGGRSGRDSCKGDSGGPLMKLQKGVHRFWLLAGVVSYGPVICGTGGVPGVYTKVSSYMPWILANLRS